MTQREIARLQRAAGQHQIAEARQAHQRLVARAQRAAKTAQFCKATRDQSGLRAGAKCATRRNSAGDGQHVFGRPANLDAAQIGRVIEAEARRRQ